LVTINTVKNLIKNKVQIHELGLRLPDEKSEAIEQLIKQSQVYLKDVKAKVKEKSHITKQFRDILEDDQRHKLKLLVAKISNEIKKLEEKLRDSEATLCAMLTQRDDGDTPIQFRTVEIERAIEGEIVFSVIETSGNWSREWADFISSFGSHSAYHRPEWLKVLSEYSGYKIYLFVLKCDGKIVAGAPALLMDSAIFGRNIISIPYVNYGGALSNSKKLIMDLLCDIKEWTKGEAIDYSEFRTTVSGLALPVKSRKCSMILRLPPDDKTLEMNLRAKVRTQCKKASMFNPQVVFGGLELLNEFYYVFSTNMRDLGTPVYGKNIFKRILQEKKIHSFICIVRVNNSAVSVAFLTGYRDMLEIPWASTLQAANKYDANMWMYRKILTKAIELKYQYFDFGRTTHESNTYKFKKQWGAKPIDHHWYYLMESEKLPEANPDNPKYRFFISVWKRIPVWIANIIGPYIVKNIP
jgi:FemAB-related protein (PEP-CTERM system-associated)